MSNCWLSPKKKISKNVSRGENKSVEDIGTWSQCGDLFSIPFACVLQTHFLSCCIKALAFVLVSHICNTEHLLRETHAHTTTNIYTVLKKIVMAVKLLLFFHIFKSQLLFYLACVFIEINVLFYEKKRERQRIPFYILFLFVFFLVVCRGIREKAGQWCLLNYNQIRE